MRHIEKQLHQEPGDIHVSKHRISGFWDTPLDAILKNLDVTTLFFAGVNADHCVLGTLMDANFHGYDTVMLEDCVATTSPDFCMQATLHNVFNHSNAREKGEDSISEKSCPETKSRKLAFALDPFECSILP